MLMLNVPHFKQILVSSFECHAECAYTNREITFIGSYERSAIEVEFRVAGKEDMNTQVVLSAFTKILVPELELEIPPREMHAVNTQNDQIVAEAHGMGSLTTIEGILIQVREDLTIKIQTLEEERDDLSKDLESSLKTFLISLNALLSGERAFTFILSDISGNAFLSPIEIDANLSINDIEKTDRYIVRKRARTQEEDIKLGLLPAE